MAVRASILIPIHNKTTTLPLTVDTVLRQSVSDLEVLLIGDGVTDGVRDVARSLVERDDRVRFLDFPKGQHHGEIYRHEGIRAAASDAIFYLCDDDLLLPDHVADLLDLLEDHDLVQSLNGWLTPAGAVQLYPGDLADPSCVGLHLRDDIRYNIVSITGTAHTRRAYLELDDRWDTTPAGYWPDHWQFRKLMRRPGFRGATSSRMTALQFPTSNEGRDTWSDEERLAEIVPWHALVTAPGGQEEINRLTAASLLPQLQQKQTESMWLSVALDERGRYVDVIAAGQREALRQLEAERAARAALQQEMDELEVHVNRLVQIRAEQQEKIDALRGRIREKNQVIAGLRGR